MKVNLKPVFAVYGPVGHPLARVQETGTNPEDLENEYHQHLSKYCLQGNLPSVFFNRDMSLEKQGYHILPVINGEIDFERIRQLPVPRFYAPAKHGEPGRTIEEFLNLLPSYNGRGPVAVWKSGKTGCDHDFGLESYATFFRLESGEVVSEDQSYGARKGEYFNTVTCTRCGAVHAMDQQS